MKNENKLLKELYEMKNLMGYLNEDFTNEGEPVVDPNQEVNPKDVQKFIEKIKALPILIKLKDKLNTKKERILGVKAIAELFELNDAELIRVSQELKQMDGVVTEEVIDEINTDNIALKYSTELERMVQELVDRGQQPIMAKGFLKNILDKTKPKRVSNKIK